MKAPSAPQIGLLLAGGLCLIPFLIPYHQLPVLSFFPEWLAVALGTAAALAALAGTGGSSVRLPAPAWWLTGFALFLAVRSASGTQAYFQLSLLGALYVLYAVLMIRLGAQLAAALGVERVATVLSAFLLAGALANAAAGAIQFYGRPALLEDVIADLSGNRAYGNIAQANLYANYLALGLGALLFLWLHARMRTAYGLCALILLVAAGALSDSRGAALYVLWYAGLGIVAARLDKSPETRRLVLAAGFIALVGLAAYFVLPSVNEAFGLGPPGGRDRLVDPSGHYSEPRGPVFILALRAFVAAPVFGHGIGEFPGAAFELGLDPSLARSGEVWTSPHNLPLHLLAETGVVGAALVLVGLAVWALRAARRYRADPQPALWWILAAAGIGLIHSMTEFPLWSAHFLGVTALLIGASSASGPLSPAASRASAIGVLATCAVLSVALALTLRDYVRLDATRFTGTRPTLAPAHQARRDAETVRELAHGLLGPVAERWIVSGAQLDRSDLAAKRAMSERVAHTWPSNDIVVRRAVLLALDARGDEAKRLLARALHSFPRRRDDTLSIIEQAYAADPGAIGPLLEIALAAPPAPTR